jgi:hypothetical protein
MVKMDTLEIRVAPGNWGDARVSDIAQVLASAGETMAIFFPDWILPPIEVSRGISEPVTHFERGPSGEIRVELNVEGPYWAQFAFQFGHEMCHILCGYGDYPNPNKWFEETLCEGASLFVLGRMAEVWKTRAPYQNWKDYSAALREYRDNRIDEQRLPEGISLADVVREKEQSLRANPLQRLLNLSMATSILPLFEAAPGHWEAVRNLNAVRGDASCSFVQYLGNWLSSSADKHGAFIRQIAGSFGVSIDL